jgi:hypothetical protein
MPLKPVIHIDIDFLMALSQQKPNAEANPKEMIVWLNLVELIRNQANLDLYVSKKEDLKSFLEAESYLAHHIINLYYQSSKRISINTITENENGGQTSVSNQFPQFNMLGAKSGDDRLSHIVKVSDTQIVADWEKCCKSYEYVITKDTKIDKSARLTCWQDLKAIEHPITNILISDPYLIGNYLKELNKKGANDSTNLHQALTTLLHKHVSLVKILISSEGSDQELEAAHKAISGFLIRQLPTLHFELGIFVPKEVQHGRYIFTDYYVLESDHSFQYFNNIGSVSLKAFARLSVHPHIRLESRPTTKASLQVLGSQLQNAVTSFGVCETGLTS